jgi:hypothetical protein
MHSFLVWCDDHTLPLSLTLSFQLSLSWLLTRYIDLSKINGCTFQHKRISDYKSMFALRERVFVTGYEIPRIVAHRCGTGARMCISWKQA